MTQSQTGSAEPAPAPPRLGEELPIFCEKCGYQLHGLVPQRCPHCAILHFPCPECGHHQPINTLRPAFQRMLGRSRAWMLSSWVVSKVIYFAAFLFAWAAMGAANSYDEQWTINAPVSAPIGPSNHLSSANVTTGLYLGFIITALCYGIIGRMLLLRWRRGWLVGLVIAALAVIAVIVGAHIRQINEGLTAPPFMTPEFETLLIVTGIVALIGATIAWGVWSGLVHVFLPRRVAALVLDWQQSSTNRVSALARESEQSP